MFDAFLLHIRKKIDPNCTFPAKAYYIFPISFPSPVSNILPLPTYQPNLSEVVAEAASSFIQQDSRRLSYIINRTERVVEENQPNEAPQSMMHCKKQEVLEEDFAEQLEQADLQDSFSPSFPAPSERTNSNKKKKNLKMMRSSVYFKHSDFVTLTSSPAMMYVYLGVCMDREPVSTFT